MARIPPYKQISALCIAQPWATCVFHHGKNVENAKRNLNLRGTIAIYASTSKAKWRFTVCREDYGIDLQWENLPKGFILGFVDIIDVITNKTVTRKTKKWFQRNHYGYVISNVRLLKIPVKAKPPNGAVKFWHLKGKTLEKCLRQLSAKELSTFKSWTKE